mmetsp:Transcript_29630/g.64460  ORF Transcript_29630/g.64460 Transcript_29630/m.64460 type:complete len:108 (-) Transcript_29630:214-537(-)
MGLLEDIWMQWLQMQMSSSAASVPSRDFKGSKVGLQERQAVGRLVACFARGWSLRENAGAWPRSGFHELISRVLWHKEGAQLAHIVRPHPSSNIPQPMFQTSRASCS